MKSFILAATVMLGATALPSTQYNVPFMGVTVGAIPMQQDPSGAPPPSSSQPAEPAASQPAPPPAPAPSQPAPDVKVDVQTTSWHPNPTWVAIGVIGAVLLVVVIVMASRSGSNTVIRG